MRLLIVILALIVAPQSDRPAWRAAPDQDWQALFNGRNLDGWIVKLAHHELGDNHAETFHVQDGAIRVMYDRYGEFGARFGHLFYMKKLSYYPTNYAVLPDGAFVMIEAEPGSPRLTVVLNWLDVMKRQFASQAAR